MIPLLGLTLYLATLGPPSRTAGGRGNEQKQNDRVQPFLAAQVEGLVNLEIPIKTYSNLKLDRIKILNEHRGKVSGIYCLINLINGHFYIGSSTNIATLPPLRSPPTL